jgi:REP element-mobilizing transposase RayT
MPSTHLSLHYHLVFSTKNRLPQIKPEWRSRLHDYLSGIVRSLDAKPLITGGIDNHVHMLFGLNATHCLADVLMQVKGSSSKWVHDTITRDFGWQDGYGGFTVSPTAIASVTNYIAHQEEHHAKQTFEEEYISLLTASGIEYDPRYLW